MAHPVQARAKKTWFPAFPSDEQLSNLLPLTDLSVFSLFSWQTIMNCLSSCPLGNILVPRAHDPSGLWLGSRALVWSKTGSPRFADFPSKLANLIGWECETNTLRMLRKSGLARALDPNHRPKGSWALGTRMEIPSFHFLTCAPQGFSRPVLFSSFW